LFELNINIVLTHVEGPKNAVADFLSRIYYVPETKSPKDSLGPKSAQHINSSFNPFPVFTCLDEEQPETNKLLLSENFGFAPESLQSMLTLPNIRSEQEKDPLLSTFLDKLDDGIKVKNYSLIKNVLHKANKNHAVPYVIVVPAKLIPIVIALYHFKTPKKLLATIRLKYFWHKMFENIQEFCKGCILCSIFKHDKTGKTEIGTPRLTLRPGAEWQMDMVTGLPRSHGFLGYLNMVDTYSGYVIPVAVKSENSQDIANVIEQYIIRPFGPPIQISSDNASNLQGPPIRKLLNFYNISQRFTVPYSPESHGLVEIQNRYVTELVRIFTDQFQCLWPDILTLSAMVLNSVPRPQLMGHSPYFIMFGHEPFGNENMEIINEKFLDINKFVAHSQNNKNYVKLVKEFLVLKRAQNNKKKIRK